MFADNIQAKMVKRHDSLFELVFNQPILIILKKIGHIPLPPYIDRADELSDKQRYQTVYAKSEGAVAAPTAGLHFDEALLAAIKAKGIKLAFVTLHVGAGTFQPVKVANISEHHMHKEWLEVSPDVVAAIKACKAKDGRVIAVGTTSVRSLETAALDGEIKPLLVAAFAGYQQAMQAYKVAVAQQYRFFSYGDAMFITHNPNAEEN